MDNLDKIDIIRKQRHDFMNVLQVIYGYLQIGKKNELERYINKVIEQYSMIGEIYRLGDVNFSVYMEEILNLLWSKNIDVDLNLEIESLNKKIFDSELDKKQNLVNTIFKDFLNLKVIIIYINIYEDSYGLNISISNNPELGDTLIDNMKRTAGLDDLSIYKIIDNPDLCYKIVIR